MNTFATELTATLKRAIAHLKADGTVGMGADNLWQVVANRISRECPSAPRGTNCAWVARQTFNDIIRQPPFNRFIL